MSTPANYVLGQSTHEYERLMLQGKLLRPFTERTFRSAGVAPGMRVLDLGSGMGDVALLLADMVGPRGCVVGLDRDATALERARQRTAEQGCSSWVSFQATNLEDFATADLFDAVVGRYILLYQPDAASTLRQLARFLKPGGIVAFHELDFPDPHSSQPPCALWDQVYALVGEAFRRAGAPPDFGRRVGPAFVGAGLPFPSIITENLVGGARGSYVYPWVANTLLSVAPRLKDLGLTPPDVALDATLAQALEDAVIAAGSQVLAPTQYGAWTRKPL
jgi:ubiquinone/menaquinone biosynthesis C-methylase UbiE